MSVFTGTTRSFPGPGRRAAEEFAALLEGGRAPAGHDLADLVALTRALVPAEHAPRPEFRASLRELLVAEAASRPAPLPRQASTSQPPPHSVPPGPRPRLRNAVAIVALAAVVTGAGAAAASTRALPGDALYGLKRQIENVQLALAGSDLARGRELLEQAEARLGEAEALAASSVATEPVTRASLGTALAEMERAADEGAVALTDSYSETGDAEPLLLLDRFVTEQQERLRDLLVLLDPSLRARVAAHLDELERTAARTAALLEPAATAVGGTKTGATGGSDGRASGDGWVVSRLNDRSSAGSVSGGGSALSSAAGTGATTAGAGGTSGGLLDDTLSGLSGGSTSGGGSGAGGGGSETGGGAAVPDASPLPKVSVPATGPVTSPLPVASPVPEPSVATLPSLEPTAEQSTSTAPLPSVPCVLVPPLTSC